jgi:hypothetical protein
VTGKRLLIVAVVTVALLTAPAYVFWRGPGSGQLLLRNASEITHQAGDYETFTWGFPLATVEGSGVLLDAELVDVEGVDVLGVGACIGDTRMDDGSWLSCGPGLGRGWPPPVTLRPVENLRLGTDPESRPMLVAGARRQRGFASGRIGGWRLDYLIDGQRFVENEPFSLVLITPPTAPPTGVPSLSVTGLQSTVGSAPR